MDYAALDSALAGLKLSIASLENELSSTTQKLSLSDSQVLAKEAELIVLRKRVADLEAQQPAPTPTPIPTPTPTTRHVLWGASYASNGAKGTNSKEAETRRMEGKMGRKADMTRHYAEGPDSSWLNDDGMDDSIASGRLVSFSFKAGSFSYSDIAAGKADTQFRTRFTELLNAGKNNPLWAKSILGFINEPINKPAAGTPSQYCAAFDHLIDLAHSVGLPNKFTTFLQVFPGWHTTNEALKGENYIPSKIDYVGVHGYGVPIQNDVPNDCITRVKSWREFQDLFTPPHRTAERLGKPLYIGETGVCDDFLTPDPERKADWFKSIPAALVNLPRVMAIQYWHSGPGVCTYKTCLRIDSSDLAEQGYVQAGKAGILTK